MVTEAHRGDVQVERLSYRPAEAAKALGVSRRKLYNLMNEGKLRSAKSGNARMIPREALLAFLADPTAQQN
jgi:excisionase family DNA binding protein